MEAFLAIVTVGGFCLAAAPYAVKLYHAVQARIRDQRADEVSAPGEDEAEEHDDADRAVEPAAPAEGGDGAMVALAFSFLDGADGDVFVFDLTSDQPVDVSVTVRRRDGEPESEPERDAPAGEAAGETEGPVSPMLGDDDFLF